MFRHVFRYTALPVALLLGTTHSAGAQNADYFPDNAIINYAVSGNAVVGYADHENTKNNRKRTNPTVHLVSGGSIAGGLQVHNRSTVVVNGGSFGYLAVGESSAIDLFGTGLHSTLVSAKGYTVKGRHLREYKLSGTLADGTSINGKRLYVQLGRGARFTLHNERSSQGR